MKKSNLKSKYSLKTYKPNHKAVAVNYKGTQYASKIQCCVLEGITRKELEAYLANEVLNPEMSDSDKINNIIL